MTMQADPAELIGAHVVGIEGEDIGPIEQVLAEGRSGMAAWARVRTGFFGKKNRLIPLALVQRSNRGVNVPFTKQQIKGGPELHPVGCLSAEQVTELTLYYGIIGATAQSTTAQPTTAQPGGAPAGQIPAQRQNPAPSHLRTH
jgi:hypothetical protein